MPCSFYFMTCLSCFSLVLAFLYILYILCVFLSRCMLSLFKIEKTIKILYKKKVTNKKDNFTYFQPLPLLIALFHKRPRPSLPVSRERSRLASFIERHSFWAADYYLLFQKNILMLIRTLYFTFRKLC